MSSNGIGSTMVGWWNRWGQPQVEVLLRQDVYRVQYRKPYGLVWWLLRDSSDYVIPGNRRIRIYQTSCYNTASNRAKQKMRQLLEQQVKKQSRWVAVVRLGPDDDLRPAQPAPIRQAGGPFENAPLLQYVQP